MRQSLRYPRRVVVGLLVVVVLSVLGMVYRRSQVAQMEVKAPETHWLLASYSANDVRVDIAIEKDAAEQKWLIGTFTPLREHFHLYSKDLPKTGVGGQGRPTLLEIIQSGEIQPLGPLLANQTPLEHYSQVIQQPLLVYPDGPVSLRMPVEWTGGNARLPIELSLTYMACSDVTCLLPVIDQRLSVLLPDLPPDLGG